MVVSKDVAAAGRATLVSTRLQLMELGMRMGAGEFPARINMRFGPRCLPGRKRPAQACSEPMLQEVPPRPIR
jgi:hypothetical protein